MATKNNAVLGYMTCEAGGRASVHRAVRGKGRHFYTRCDCCGCDQRTGATFQTHVYNSTQWLGDKPIAPVNYLGEGAPKSEPVVQPTEPSSDAGLADDWQPKEEPKKEAVGQPKGRLALSLLVSLALGGLALIVGRGV